MPRKARWYILICKNISVLLKISHTASVHTWTLRLLTTNKILKKVGEECTEVIISCKEDNKEEQINEFADLIYHLLVLMVDRSISIKEIEEELIKRSKKINNFKGERKNIEKL